MSQAACRYALATTTTNIAATASSGTVDLTAGAGCTWSAATSTNWIHTTSSGTGPGTVSYSVDANPAGSLRSGTITVNGQPFTVTQAATLLATVTVQANPSNGGTVKWQRQLCGRHQRAAHSERGPESELDRLERWHHQRHTNAYRPGDQPHRLGKLPAASGKRAEHYPRRRDLHKFRHDHTSVRNS